MMNLLINNDIVAKYFRYEYSDYNDSL